jgi:hypothetical protein
MENKALNLIIFFLIFKRIWAMPAARAIHGFAELIPSFGRDHSKAVTITISIALNS